MIIVRLSGDPLVRNSLREIGAAKAGSGSGGGGAGRARAAAVRSRAAAVRSRAATVRSRAAAGVVAISRQLDHANRKRSERMELDSTKPCVVGCRRKSPIRKIPREIGQIGGP